MYAIHTARGVGDFSASKAVLAGQAVSMAGSVATTIAIAVGAIAPPVGAAIAAFAAIAGPIIGLFQGCGQTCVQATQYANQAADAMTQIANAYWSQTVRTVAMQQAALQNMQQIMQAMQQACSNPALGSAGQRCISERLIRGGTAPWCPTPDHTGCDMWTVNYDPIANDTGVVPDSPVGAGAAAIAGSSVAGLPVPLLLGGGLILLGLMAR